MTAAIDSPLTGSVFEEYTVLADYQPTGDSEISAKAGDIVKVVKKDEMPGTCKDFVHESRSHV